MAAWLIHASELSDHLVTLDSSCLGGDGSLSCLSGEPIIIFQQPLTPSELIAEICGTPKAMAEDRVVHQVESLFVYESGNPSDASILISLYNYSDEIEYALNSAESQSLSSLELIIVDDASSDGSVEKVSLWLNEHSSRFSRAVLLRHQENRGLAAARNTAFKAATADWAFVLDADNLLFPKAVEACLQLANNASSGVAVIHPWIEIVCKGSHRHDGRSLVSRNSWSREAFLQGNVLDAMALIRRSAWFSVGGYTHIDGGWEDFDFWCKLIEAGFHGLLCPRVLARYHSHARSMTAQSTASNWRPLSRCLQERHPWLNLPYAT